MMGSHLVWFQIVSALILLVILAINGACCLSPCCKIRRKNLRLLASSQPNLVLWFLIAAQLQVLVFASDSIESSGKRVQNDDIPTPKNIELSADDQRKIMMAIYAGIGSFQLVVGAIVVCILGMHGACCLCPKTEQQRLVELMKMNKAG
jgi:cytochrome bd-type quinol oxidase subunit 2